MGRLMLVLAAVFAAGGGLIWFAFLRPVPVRETTARIGAKTYKPAGTYWQQQVGTARGFRTPMPIPIAECYVLELHSPELGSTGFFSVPPAEEARYQVGQQVVIEYQLRGLPLIGHRITVLSVRPQ